MMKFSKLTISCLLASTAFSFFAYPVKAENWFFLLDDDSNIKHFLDRTSIKRKGNVVEVKAFQVSPKTDEDGSVATVALFEISCREKRFRVKQESVLYEDRSVRASRNPSDWEAVQKDTVADVMMQEVCKAR
ncbi:MAG: hypothetical protein SFW36_13700 [Leptolyngbyaceae cyanobacterium bins.59]|nr:hypothetical protein [Leptolyngbyaceae cyanobacterium bins.59]